MKSKRPIAIIIVGIEASGKTRLSTGLCELLHPCRAFSDYLRGTYKGLADAEDYEEFRETIRLGYNAILNDVYWVDPKPLERAQIEIRQLAPKHRLLTVYFENDPERCLVNSVLRNKSLEHDRTYIESRKKTYIVPNPLPPDSLAIPVWNTEIGDQSLVKVLTAVSSIP